MLKLFNTLSRTKEVFRPLTGNTVTMYSCGPTVYSYAHIGNLRTYVFMDLARRVLLLNGYAVSGMMNITDVGHLLSDGDEGEDKMAVAAREQQKTPYEIAAYYTDIFMRDIGRLNIGTPEIVGKATENINEMIDYVVGLMKKGLAYETSDGVYFDIERFPGYGKLSRLHLDDQIAGARVEVNSEKHHPADFALWKKAEKNHIMQWDSPWGKGYPGWHIECSAMIKKFLGDVIDIHSGGVDHIPVHHENEIAQSEGLLGRQTVKTWLHGEFMLVDGGKMSKSLKNTYTLDQLLDRGFEPLSFRYFCLNTHYRKKLNFTFEGLAAAQTAYKRLLSALYVHKTGTGRVDAARLDAFKEQFRAAVNDDLNVPLALGVTWTMVKEPASPDIYELALAFDRVLGLGLQNAAASDEPEPDDIPAEIVALAEKRKAVRAAKNWAESDRLRDELAERGYVVLDTKDGYQLTKKSG